MEKPIEFGPPSKLAGRFAQFPAWIFRCGLWARLTYSQSKVLAALCYFADNKTHICRPSRRSISTRGGVCASSIGIATNQLRDLGAIKKWRRGNRVHYQVLFSPPDWIAERGDDWKYPDKPPKGSAPYRRNGSSGRFEAEDFGVEDAETIAEITADDFGDGSKSLEQRI
jgi:hypothetical protein